LTSPNKNNVIEVLEEVARLLELADENPFKVRAMLNGVEVVKKLPGDFTKAYEEGVLKTTKGIGPALLRIIDEVMAGAEVTELSRLRSVVPPGLMELTHIPGLGAKRARRLWLELDIKSLGELEYALGENRLLSLKGFGPATSERIKEGLAQVKSTQNLFRYDQLLATFERLKSTIPQRLQPVGAFARGEEIADQLEIAVLGEQVANPDTTEKVKLTWHVSDNENSFGAFTVCLSSEPEFFRELQTHAQTQGLELTAAQLLKNSKPLPTPDEESFFKALGLWFIPPERRQHQTPLILLGSKEPRLITLKDLQGAFHNHTVASDGVNTLEEMRAEAIRLGLTYLSINDHSQTSVYAQGLKPDRVTTQREQIAALNRDAFASKCWLFTGTESDILGGGALDFSPEVLQDLEVVIASVHNRLKENPEQMTARLVNAIQNPFTMILGHPTGRLLLARPPSQFDMALVLETAKLNGVVMELNANPQRLDLGVAHLRMAQELGVKIAINADAHSTHGLSDLQYGIVVARKASLGPKDVLNCLPLDDIRAWVQTAKTRALTCSK
jgi:DNA polymerase (family 10)